MLIEQPPALLRALYPDAIWRMDPSKKEIYLTFDDGPIPRVTPWVLDTLESYGIRATFFMVADNARRHPRELAMVRERGHLLGNHTFHHVRGLQMGIRPYAEDVRLADNLLHTPLFRPPHGFMSPAQYAYVRRHFHIVMWDLVTRDYSRRLDGPAVLRKVKHYARNGSIVTFHDSLKSEEKLRYALPRAIEWLASEGYAFRTFDALVSSPPPFLAEGRRGQNLVTAAAR